MFAWICILVSVTVVSGYLPSYYNGNDVQFRFYTRDRPSYYYKHILASRLVLYGAIFGKDIFNPERPTVIYMKGYWCDLNTESSTAIRDAYLRYTDYNYIAVNWDTEYTWYFTAVANAVNIGPMIADLVEDLISAGASESSIHIIGFSLGAHVAGYTGRALKDRGVTIGRITGLDPASPGFKERKTRLSRFDAAFVDIIHTDTKGLGLADRMGDVDFYPNYDRWIMPGCWFRLPGCSHSRSWKYYVKSIRSPYDFPARSSISWTTNYMGMKALATVPGVFLLKTD